jgi:hypothetical protein
LPCSALGEATVNAYVVTIAQLTKSSAVEWKQCGTTPPVTSKFSTISSVDTAVKLSVQYRNNVATYLTIEQVISALSSDLNLSLMKALQNAVGSSRKDVFQSMTSNATVLSDEPIFPSMQPTSAAAVSSIITSSLNASSTTAIIASTVVIGSILLLAMALYYLGYLPRVFYPEKVEHVGQ